MEFTRRTVASAAPTRDDRGRIDQLLWTLGDRYARPPASAAFAALVHAELARGCAMSGR